MKIWLDVTLGSSNENVECDDCGDCSDCGDCGVYGGYRSYIDLSFKNGIHQHIRTCLIRQTESLYIQRCYDEKWLVCNPTHSGWIAVVDRQALDLLEQFRTPVALPEIISRMPNCSPASIENAAILFHRLEFLYDVHHTQIPQGANHLETLSAWLHVTNACNLRCHYCYLHKSSEHMPDTVAERAINAIFRSATRHRYQRVLLKYAGGEASLQLANVLAIHDHAVQLAHLHGFKLYAYIMSNGVALSQRVIDQLKERHIGVMISLDGVGSYHDCQRPFVNGQGSFRYVDRTITRLRNSNLIPHINATISQQNLEGLPAFMEYLLEHELPFTLSYYRDNECSAHLHDLQFTDVQMITAMRLAFDVIEQRLPKRRLIGSLIDKANMTAPHRHTCSVGHSYLVVDQHGGIAKCHAAIKQTITTIDADDPLQMIRDDREGVQGVAVESKEGCRACQWRYWCTGGCPLLTYRITGRSDIKSPNCNIYQALFPEALRLEALRLLKYTSPIIF